MDCSDNWAYISTMDILPITDAKLTGYDHSGDLQGSMKCHQGKQMVDLCHFVFVFVFFFQGWHACGMIIIFGIIANIITTIATIITIITFTIILVVVVFVVIIIITIIITTMIIISSIIIIIRSSSKCSSIISPSSPHCFKQWVFQKEHNVFVLSGTFSDKFCNPSFVLVDVILPPPPLHAYLFFVFLAQCPARWSFQGQLIS